MDDHYEFNHELKVSKNTQKFISDLAELHPTKRKEIVEVLNALSDQQQSEAHMENKRGWRYMWQRTPKPYLLMLAYLVFLAPVGSIGYQAFNSVPVEFKTFFLISLLLVLLLPLTVVFYLSYQYVHKKIKNIEVEK